ncbi:MAG: hypothetical protein K2H52_11550 [Lachnospiraceae bacterium]|nr:hypothetical protein [Lachnospiraceae bacterium]
MNKVDGTKILEEQNCEEVLADATEDELHELKIWLFKENVRLKMEQSELKHGQDALVKEKKQFEEEMKKMTRELEFEQKRLKQDESFFDKKMDILKNAFAQLDVERKKLERDRVLLEAEKRVHETNARLDKNMEVAELLFQGVNSQLALKKRYRDLIKMFHPDNIAGDHEMVLVINRIYDELKTDYEMGKRA